MTRTESKPEGAVAAIAAILDRAVAGGEILGAVVSVDRGGDVRTLTAGTRDRVAGEPMRPDTLFRTASITKPVTAAAVMALVEEGVLALDAPVDRWLPELADRRVLRSLSGPVDDTVPARRPITVRDLLACTMGLGAIWGDPDAVPLVRRIAAAGLDPSAGPFPGSADDYVRALATLPLAAHPGERWLYHTGLDVAGVLVARATGRSFGAVLRERILDPVGMGDTGFRVDPAARDRVATCYRRDASGTLVPVDAGYGADPVTSTGMEAGGGGLVSTAPDMGAFMRMLLDRGVARGRRVLAAESVAAMTTDQIPADVKAVSPFFPDFWATNGWGLGIGIVVAPDRVSPVPGRFGWWGGTGTAAFADPATDTVVVVMTQRMMAAADDARLSAEILTAAFRNAGATP